MKTLLFIMSSAAFSVWAGVQIVNLVDPLPTHLIYYGAIPKMSLKQTIEAMRKKHGFPKGLIEAVIAQESGGKSKAKNSEKKLCRVMSAKGWTKTDCASRGLMGVVYGWHKDSCGLSSPSDLYDPATNIRCGAAVLKEKIKLANGDIRKGLNFYNADKSGRYAVKVLSKWRRSRNG